MFDLSTLKMHGAGKRVVPVAGCGADGVWCPTRTFSLVLPAEPDPAVGQVVRFICGVEGAAILRALGYDLVACDGEEKGSFAPALKSLARFGGPPPTKPSERRHR